MKKICTFCFDLDGVICNNTYGKYDEAKPFKEAINKINNLFNDGHHIIIFTARYMGRNRENTKIVYKKYYLKTYNQIKKWNTGELKVLL